jgi:5-formyltetrahydrofolate cyclo-ligase
MSTPITTAKKLLRGQMRSRVGTLSMSHRAEASTRIVDTLIATRAWARAQACLAYVAMPDEPDLTGLLLAVLSSGRRLALPRVMWQEKSMVAAIVDNLSTDLVPTRPGLLEPTESCPMLPVEEIGVVIVPAMAYDSSSRARLGRGGGVYDRWLLGYAGATRALRATVGGCSDQVVVGVCFDEQLVENLPTEAHDARVDAIVTDRRIIDPMGRLT